MKAIRILEPNKLQITDVEKPVINEKDNVLIKMKAAGICGSDVGITAQMLQPHTLEL